MIDIKELYWAAGFYEGEGTCTCAVKKKNGSYLIVSANQVNPEPLHRLQRVFGGRVGGPYTRPSDYRNNKPIYYWSAQSIYAAGILMTLYSLLSEKRQEQLKIALAKYFSAPVANKYKTHCRAGHPYSEFKKTGRNCRGCQRTYTARYLDKHPNYYSNYNKTRRPLLALRNTER